MDCGNASGDASQMDHCKPPSVMLPTASIDPLPSVDRRPRPLSVKVWHTPALTCRAPQDTPGSVWPPWPPSPPALWYSNSSFEGSVASLVLSPPADRPAHRSSRCHHMAWDTAMGRRKGGATACVQVSVGCFPLAPAAPGTSALPAFGMPRPTSKLCIYRSVDGGWRPRATVWSLLSALFCCPGGCGRTPLNPFIGGHSVSGSVSPSASCTSVQRVARVPIEPSRWPHHTQCPRGGLEPGPLPRWWMVAKLPPVPPPPPRRRHRPLQMTVCTRYFRRLWAMSCECCRSLFSVGTEITAWTVVLLCVCHGRAWDLFALLRFWSACGGVVCCANLQQVDFGHIVRGRCLVGLHISNAPVQTTLGC